MILHDNCFSWFLSLAPPNSGSSYFNYKGHHSINLMAISDARYCFTIVDIGAEGRHSDGGVFRNSMIGQRFEEGSFKLPEPKELEAGGPKLPYVLLADEAFPLSTYMLRPYPRSGKLDIGKKVFNYRLSRARRVVESAFGILAARWRIYRVPITARVPNAIKIVQATVALHNFIIQNEEQHTGKNGYTRMTPEETRLVSNGLSDMAACRGRLCVNATAIREAYSLFFRNAGALPFQWEKAVNNDF